MDGNNSVKEIRPDGCSWQIKYAGVLFGIGNSGALTFKLLIGFELISIFLTINEFFLYLRTCF